MTSGKWPQRTKGREVHPTCRRRHDPVGRAVKELARIVPVLYEEETVGVSRARRVSIVFRTTGGESWCQRFRTDNK